MSTGLNCQFIEPEPGRWFYLLEDWSSPKGAWDWREFATAYGPFDSFEEAHEHLRENHANPGGYSIVEHGEYQTEEVLEQLVAEARRPQPRYLGGWR